MAINKPQRLSIAAATFIVGAGALVWAHGVLSRPTFILVVIIGAVTTSIFEYWLMRRR